MPSALHEALVTLFRHRPSLAPILAAGHAQELELPADDRHIHVASAEFAELEPAEYRADLVVRIDDDEGRPRDVMVVEVQLEIDAGKRYSWPLYMVGARARFRCPATLVVVTLDEAVARWCRRPIVLDRVGQTLTPVVIGPALIPAITEPEIARATPELAVLSAMAHGREPGSEEIALAALAGCTPLDNQRGALYADLVLARLNEAARSVLEVLMAQHGYTYQSDFAKKYVARGIEEGKREGIEEGKREALRTLFGQRFGELPADLATKIDEGRGEVLSRWLQQILTASTPDEVFAD